MIGFLDTLITNLQRQGRRIRGVGTARHFSTSSSETKKSPKRSVAIFASSLAKNIRNSYFNNNNNNRSKVGKEEEKVFQNMIDDYEFLGAGFYEDSRDKFVCLKGEICQEGIEIDSVRSGEIYFKGIHIGGPRFGEILV